jgi:hypothetical protein
MCKEDTIVLRTYIHIYIFFLKNRFLGSISVPYITVSFYIVCFFPEEALVTSHESFHLNEIEFITASISFFCLFLILFTFFLCFSITGSILP